MRPTAQAGRAESGAAALGFQDSPVADLQRGSEISLQPAMGRKQEMSAALPGGALPVSKLTMHMFFLAALHMHCWC